MGPGRSPRWWRAILPALALVAGVLPGAPGARAAPGGAGPCGPARADRILIEKGERRLSLLQGGAPIRQYRVALGRNPVGRKEVRGDDRTPEGIYSIDRRNGRSRYHRALHISYPNRQDIENARSKGAPPGGDIMIHGLPNGLGSVGPLHRAVDWTRGCVAVTNREIEEIWDLVPDGATVEIRP